MSQRKSIILAEEAPPGSPLRRSSRIATGSPVPAQASAAPVTKRRSSANLEQASVPAKISRVKRLSLSQEITEDRPPTPKRGTRSRAGSKSPTSLDAEVKAPGTPSRRGRKSSVTKMIEDESEPDHLASPKTVGTRRRSLRGQSTSPTNVPTEQPAKPRTRRGSVTEKVTPLEAIDETEPPEDEPKRQRSRPTRATKIDTIEENENEGATPTKILSVQIDAAEEAKVKKAIVKARYSNSPDRFVEGEKSQLTDSKLSRYKSRSVSAENENIGEVVKTEEALKEKKLSESVEEPILEQDPNLVAKTDSASVTLKASSQSTKSASPSTKSASPSTKSASPSTKSASPSTKSASPATRSATQSTKPASPSTKSLSPSIKSPDLKEPQVLESEDKAALKLEVEDPAANDAPKATSPKKSTISLSSTEKSPKVSKLQPTAIKDDKVSSENEDPESLTAKDVAAIKKSSGNNQDEDSQDFSLELSPNQGSTQKGSPEKILGCSNKESVTNSETREHDTFLKEVEAKPRKSSSGEDSLLKLPRTPERRSPRLSISKIGSPRTTSESNEMSDSSVIEDEMPKATESESTNVEDNVKLTNSPQRRSARLSLTKTASPKEVSDDKISLSISKESEFAKETIEQKSESLKNEQSPTKLHKEISLTEDSKIVSPGNVQLPKLDTSPKQTKVSDTQFDSSTSKNIQSDDLNESELLRSDDEEITNVTENVGKPIQSNLNENSASNANKKEKIEPVDGNVSDVSNNESLETTSPKRNKKPAEQKPTVDNVEPQKILTASAENTRVTRSSLTLNRSPTSALKSDSLNNSDNKDSMKTSNDSSFKSPKPTAAKKKPEPFLENELSMSYGSDGSFHLNLSLPVSNTSQELRGNKSLENLNTSSGSEGSDKENSRLNQAKPRLSGSVEVKGPANKETALKQNLSVSADENIINSPTIKQMINEKQFESMDVDYISDEEKNISMDKSSRANPKKSLTPNKPNKNESDTVLNVSYIVDSDTEEPALDKSEEEILDSFVDELKDENETNTESNEATKDDNKTRKSASSDSKKSNVKDTIELNTSTPDKEISIGSLATLNELNLSQNSNDDSRQSKKDKKKKSLDSKETIKQRIINLENTSSEEEVFEETDIDVKLDSFIADKLKSAEYKDCSEDDEDRNSFLDDMASEGEEDTPSEGSNDIIEHGESIHSSDTDDDSYDEDYENDSFVVDDEIGELLSGEEYDLDYDGKKELKKKKKKSRIISVNDDSDAESEDSVPLLIDSEGKNESGDKIKIIQDIKITPKKSLINKEDNLKSLETIKLSDSVGGQDNEQVHEKKTVFPGTQTPNNSFSGVISSIRKSRRTASISFQEDIQIRDIADGNITEKITKVVDLLCSSIKENAGNVSLNVSLDYATNSNNSDDVAVQKLKPLRRSDVMTISDYETSLESKKEGENKKPRNSAPILIYDDEDDFISEKEKVAVARRSSTVLITDDGDSETEAEKTKNLKKQKISTVLINDDADSSSEEEKTKKVKPRSSNIILIKDDESFSRGEVIKEVRAPRRSSTLLISKDDATFDQSAEKKNKKAKSLQKSIHVTNKDESEEQSDVEETFKIDSPEKPKRKKGKKSKNTVCEIEPICDNTFVRVDGSSKKMKIKQGSSKEIECSAEKHVGFEIEDEYDDASQLSAKKASKKKRKAKLSSTDETNISDDDSQTRHISPYTKSKKRISMQEQFRVESDHRPAYKKIKLVDEPIQTGSRLKKRHYQPDVSDEIRVTVPKKTKKAKSIKKDIFKPSTINYLPEKFVDEVAAYPKASSSKAALKPKHKKLIIVPSKVHEKNNWDIHDIDETLPSRNSTSTKAQLDVITNRLPANDFKNRMLYDSTRIKRMDAKKIFKNKESSSFKR